MSFSNHKRTKSFGQHWLKDNHILDKILEAANLDPNDSVLEIGPGRGALTQKLLDSEALWVNAVEIDKTLISDLINKFSHYPKFNLIEGNILSAPLNTFKGSPPNKVVANIPYNITGPILQRLLGRLGLEPAYKYNLLVLLLQKDVAERILASPGHSNYSALSVRMQLLCNSYSICDVSPCCFDPAPRVDSKVILIKPFNLNQRSTLEIETTIEIMLKKVFLERRKKLRNTLSAFSDLVSLELLAKDIGITLDQRPQELSPMNWIDLAKGINLHYNTN